MSAIPTWVTPAGTLGTIPEGVFYSIPLLAVADTTVYYQVIAGKLPPGIQIDETGILSGNPSAKASVQGVPLQVTSDTTSKFTVRASTQAGLLSDRTFSLTISGQSTVAWFTPAGLVGTYIDGVQVNNLALSYTDSDRYAVDVVTLIAGSLPPGLTVSSTGVISGYITPNPTATVTETVYSFTLRVSNGFTSDVRTFSIAIYARNLMTADNIVVTGDNTYITADIYPITPPIVTTPTGSIGTVRSDNFFAFQFTGKDFSDNAIKFRADTALPPGLTLDPNSGWLYGYIPYGGVIQTTYTFKIDVYEVANLSNHSDLYTYTLTISGPVNSDVIWLTPSDPVALAQNPSSLGTINNGAISTLYVEAQNIQGLPLQYRLVSGSDSRLPQGLQLLTSGNIAGRVSFDTFVLDGGTTTFDVGLNTVRQPTTFDMVATFTVNAYSVNGLVNVTKTFSITVVRAYQQPYDNLYIQAMPPESDRVILNNLLQNPTIFPPALIYRNDDPNFGVANRVIYDHAYGLTASSLDTYVASLNENHYWKDLVLGKIKTAQALDDAGNVLYEVVYSEVVDNLVNNAGESVSKEVVLPFPIAANTANQVDVVFPNSLVDMRTQVIDSVGQVSNVLPRWMLSRQIDGSVLGFTPAWVIAYTNPGQSGQIAYNIETLFNTQLNIIDFRADRYEIDGFLTKNWNRNQQYWGFDDSIDIPHPPSLTTFDINGTPPFSATKSYQPGNIVLYQTVYDNVIIAKVYVCKLATTPGTLPTNTAHWSDNGADIATWINNSNVLTNWEDNLQTMATWTYGTPPGTTFDGGSLQFTAPVDMYSPTNTTDYDSYLLFPKRNILENLVQINQQEWTGNANVAIEWTNSTDQPIVFTSRTT